MSSRTCISRPRRWQPTLYCPLRVAGERYAAGERDAEALRQPCVVLDAEPWANHQMSVLPTYGRYVS